MALNFVMNKGLSKLLMICASFIVEREDLLIQGDWEGDGIL